jgi:hypothetical protein
MPFVNDLKKILIKFPQEFIHIDYKKGIFSLCKATNMCGSTENVQIPSDK